MQLKISNFLCFEPFKTGNFVKSKNFIYIYETFCPVQWAKYANAWTNFFTYKFKTTARNSFIKGISQLYVILRKIIKRVKCVQSFNVCTIVRSKFPDSYQSKQANQLKQIFGISSTMIFFIFDSLHSFKKTFILLLNWNLR